MFIWLGLIPLPSWKPAKCSFSIENISEIPCLYDIDCPGFIDIVSYGTEDYALKRRIECEQTKTIECSLQPRLLDPEVSGSQLANIMIKNIFNPHNTCILAVKYYVSQFELKFERLNAGGLELPPLLVWRAICLVIIGSLLQILWIMM